ncbi:hypothetical protein BAUCODRAFT_25510 [Baudoinia panamericana UAMH 10762]|uniref:FAD-binding domain-containing protein n=1 Tax=Baudoinia panamericana (strain UAMH 10762) TaxID=717646 RepID=M2LMH6_BAUPA|nr:uncharacterized protein BAUCODRAFT_25510 [Baudoinia panamericana UAMH 10762]EMC95502.1 hypothetical protein BAUCODRAFT_25510 [Baudoinia panamericana UAMH 10762]
MIGGHLKVTIVGAGLAGTIATRVLREFHDVTLIERTPSTRQEFGAAINMGPTVTSWLESVGFDRKKAGSLVATQSRMYSGKSGEELQKIDMAPFAQHNPSDWLFQHRADLWSEFFRLATGPADEVALKHEDGSVRCIWNAEVLDIDVNSGDVTLADGRVIPSDLVIGADGIRSVVRHKVVGEEAFRSARPSGSSAFRLTIPAEIVPKASADKFLNREAPVSLEVFLSLDSSNRSVVMYPCRDFQLLNMACIAPDNVIGVETEESWFAKGRKTDLDRCFEDFCPEIKSLLGVACDDTVNLWQLRDQDPLPTYINGRTVLIGDAAHAMTPHQGQGGTQAVEDAAAFQLFAHATRATVPTILKDFDRVRRTRASQIQNNTREAHERKTPERLWKHSLYNWTYPGINECLRRLNAGEEMIDV